MAEYLKWKDTLEIGDDANDAAHRLMLQLANTFMDKLAQGQSEKILHGILEHLIDISKEHFRAEEISLKKQLDHDSFAHHRSEHIRLIDEMRMLDNGFAASKLGVEDVLPFFKEWIFDHIEKLDMKTDGPNKSDT